MLCNITDKWVPQVGYCKIRFIFHELLKFIEIYFVDQLIFLIFMGHERIRTIHTFTLPMTRNNFK